MTDNAFLIALGAFITSTGFASLVAITAVVATWRAGKAQIVASRNAADKNAREARELADKNDSRQRWWEALLWFHQQRQLIGEKAFREGVEALSSDHLVRTEAQRAILKAVTCAPKP